MASRIEQGLAGGANHSFQCWRRVGVTDYYYADRRPSLVFDLSNDSFQGCR
jgi:hypothetical protein